jgi:redox-regulated HSP33 family molecular chaperone
MKMQVLRDAKGEMIATFERTRGAVVSVRAEEAEGQKLHEEEIEDKLLDEYGILGVFRHQKAGSAERDLGD